MKDHIAGTVYLLENLGFVINYPKSVLEPKRIIDFLGFQVDSTSMELKLPGLSLKSIRGGGMLERSSQPKKLRHWKCQDS